MKHDIIYINNGIGDLISLIPSIKQLKNGKYLFITKSDFNRKIILAFLNKNIKAKFLILDKKTFYKDIIKLSKLVLHFKKYNLYLPMASYGRLKYLLCILFPGKVYTSNNFTGYFVNHISTNPNSHLTEQLFSFFSSTGLVESKVFEHSVIKNTKKENHVYIGLSCGIKEKHKVPSPKWVNKLLKELVNIDNNVRFQLCGHDSEKEYFDTILRDIDTKNYILNFNQDFLDIVKKISTCSFAIVGTNGHGHLASITDTKIICLSGVANAKISGPYSSNMTILEPNIKCLHCYDRGLILGCGIRSCIDLINIESVIDLIISPN
jgi:ADP-heptose:LPS heptosyltransferase